MDHSVEGYLQRQSTQTLELLLQQYEDETSETAHYIARLIQMLLEERKAYAPFGPLV